MADGHIIAIHGHITARGIGTTGTAPDGDPPGAGARHGHGVALDGEPLRLRHGVAATPIILRVPHVQTAPSQAATTTSATIIRVIEALSTPQMVADPQRPPLRQATLTVRLRRLPHAQGTLRLSPVPQPRQLQPEAILVAAAERLQHIKVQALISRPQASTPIRLTRVRPPHRAIQAAGEIRRAASREVAEVTPEAVVPATQAEVTLVHAVVANALAIIYSN